MNEKFEKALEVILLLHERNKFLEEELKTEISKKELIGSFLNRQTKELEEVKKVKTFLEVVNRLMEESVIEVNEANRQLGGKCESLVLQSVSDAVKIKDMQEKVTNLEAELNDRISNDDVKYMVHMQETMEKNYDKLFKEYHDLKSDFFKINQENFNMKRKIKNKDTIIRNLEIDEEEIDRLKAEVAEGIEIENQLFDGYFKLISEYAKQSIFLEDVLAENKTLKADLEAHRPFRNVAAFEPF